MSEPTMKQIRDGWRDRLLKAELPTEVVDSFLAGVADEDLVRMKDLPDEQLLATMREALEEEDMDEEEEESPSTTKDNLAESVTMLADVVAAKVKEQIQETFGTVEVEVPELGQLLTEVQALKEQTEALAVAYKELTATWKEVGQDDGERIRDMVRDLSPAQRIRLRQSLTEGQTAVRAATFKGQQQRAAASFPTPNQPSTRPEPGAPAVLPPTTPDGAAIYDAEGNPYASLTEMAHGKRS